MNIFSESQRFNQWWIWALLLAAPGTIVVIDVVQHPSAGILNPITWLGIVIALSSILFMRVMVLRTAIDDYGVSYQFFPIHLKPRKKSWDDISRAYVRQYRPIAEYGGWGIRFSGHGMAYNIRGNMGLQLEFKNGKQLLIGTQKPGELKDALQQLKRNSRVAVDFDEPATNNF